MYRVSSYYESTGELDSQQDFDFLPDAKRAYRLISDYQHTKRPILSDITISEKVLNINDA